MTTALTRITAKEYMECVNLATTTYPVAWSKVMLIIENLKKYPGYNFSPLDTFQQMAGSVFQIQEYFSGKMHGLSGLVNSVLKIRTFKDGLEAAGSEPYDASFITKVNGYWTNGVLPEEFINEERTFCMSKINENIAGGLKHANVPGTIGNPISGRALEHLVVQCVQDVDLTNDFLWIRFKQSEKVEPLPFILEILIATDQAVSEYLGKRPTSVPAQASSTLVHPN